jgi:hypothetical protein
MRWKGKLINNVIEQLKNDGQWGSTIEKMLIDSSIGIHLAIFNEPFLSLIYKREKKVESRFSINRISPFERVRKGDIVILKESGGLVTGVFLAGDVKYYYVSDKKKLTEIEEKYSEAICASYDKTFWKKRVKAKYASLIEVSKVKKIADFKADKSDRTAWVVLREGISDDLFKREDEN